MSQSSPPIPRSPATTPLKSSYGYQPLCFHKEVFSSPSYSVDGFIADCRKRVPLESVKSDLNEYFTSLENELVELINKDYTDFVNLSANLAGIDEVLNELRGPLGEIKSEAQAFNARIKTLIEYTEGKFKEKQEVIAKKQYLRLFISISSSIEKLEHLLSEAELKTFNEPQQEIAMATFIDRIANEYNMLRFYLSYAKQLSVPQAMLDTFSSKSATLVGLIDNEVSKHFRQTVVTTSKSINAQLSTQFSLVGPCLRVYSALNKRSSAYEIYKTMVVKPRVNQIVTLVNLEKGSRGTSEGLNGIFDALLEFVKADCSPFLSKVREDRYDFLSNAVWAEMETTISSRIAKIFAIGISETFHQNYKACFAFLAKLEILGCDTVDSLVAFRAHGSYTAFEKRWNTSVYRQMRFTEIAGAVESGLCQPQQPDNVNTDSDNKAQSTFKLPGTTILWKELQRIWSPDVYLILYHLWVPLTSVRFIHELTGQFTKLTLQLLSRYSSWVYASYASSAVASSLKDSTSVNLSENLDESAVSMWSKLMPSAYSLLYHDVSLLVLKLQASYQDFVKSALQQEGSIPPPAPLLSLIQGAIQSATEELARHLTHLSTSVTSHLAKKCIESLQPLTKVTATYRLTDRRVPTRANDYVDDVVAILDEFFHTHASFIVVEDLKAWQHKVLEEVTTSYEGIVTDVLNNAHTAEERLLKLVRKKSVATGISDIDKIYLQLFLDVSKYGELLRSKLKVDPNNFPPYFSLFSCVASGEKFKNMATDNVQ